MSETEGRPEVTVELATFDVTVTYPYHWPGFVDGVYVHRRSLGKGNVYERAYFEELCRTTLDLLEASDDPR